MRDESASVALLLLIHPSAFILHPFRREALVRRDLAQEDVAHLFARHVEVHQELLAV
jgi:hypothetical protein